MGGGWYYSFTEGEHRSACHRSACGRFRGARAAACAPHGTRNAARVGETTLLKTSLDVPRSEDF